MPCGPINRIDQVFADPHVVERAMRREMAHPSGAMVPMVANPMRLSASPVAYRLAGN